MSVFLLFLKWFWDVEVESEGEVGKSRCCQGVVSSTVVCSTGTWDCTVWLLFLIEIPASCGDYCTTVWPLGSPDWLNPPNRTL